MHVLLLGATGNLGLRLLPALLAHGHTVVAFIRSESKLRRLTTPRLFSCLTIYIGDALDTRSVEAALRQHGCDAVVNTAGNFAPPWRDQYLGKIAESVSGAATRVGRERGTVLRVWVIGGLTSLVYPYEGNVEGWTVQDFFPRWAGQHHRGTEEAMKRVGVEEREWTVLCVGWMWPESRVVDSWEGPREGNLVMKVDEMPDWQGSVLGKLPVVGRFLDLFWCFSDYSTQLEDVADLIAAELARDQGRFVGCFVGMKERAEMRAKAV